MTMVEQLLQTLRKGADGQRWTNTQMYEATGFSKPRLSNPVISLVRQGYLRRDRRGTYVFQATPVVPKIEMPGPSPRAAVFHNPQPARAKPIAPEPEPAPRAHPLIMQLMYMLPPKGSKFSAQQRVSWLKSLNECADLVYGTNNARCFRIEVAPYQLDLDLQPPKPPKPVAPEREFLTIFG